MIIGYERLGGHAPCSILPEHHSLSRARTKVQRDIVGLMEALLEAYFTMGFPFGLMAHVRWPTLLFGCIIDRFPYTWRVPRVLGPHG
jgi:hypothetical protein